MKTKVLAIDFVKDHIAHQIFCEVPGELFEQYRPPCSSSSDLSTPQPNHACKENA